ncbi:hypothetical protein P3X46_024647 [Hevea brasiliensis]|uniref:Uncharacterized protein n=1 Tax=Hevea brasiliensis TaxID=3981 RepID=A0ABQ9L6Q4_HEVBR|nr:uncharacterized protein LOC110648373 [Hevea brasiliensis]XP_057989956.1 uncharacterized protein LOC110648373 [Hevea brasiliensis]XP_057989957.1 uncharacterized protein LOC110648373 [Hevea brasiliensis]KAJ9159121.1 hypothetical protein P3X46_024647 [Hevea brasiliensis]
MALLKRIDSSKKDEMHIRISKMGASIEIAQNSIQETSSSGPNGEPNSGFSSSKQNLAPNQELLASVSDCELKSDSSLSESDIECGMIDESQELELYQQQSDHMIDKGIGMIDDANNVLDVALDSSFAIEQHGNTSKALGGTYCLAVFTDEVDNSVIEQERGSECCSPAPMSDQKLCSIENDVNLVGTDKQENCETDKVDKTSSVEVEIGIVSNDRDADNDIVPETVQQSFKEGGGL